MKTPVFSRGPRKVSDILSGFNRLMTDLKGVVDAQEQAIQKADEAIARQEQTKFEARAEIDAANNALAHIGKIVGSTGE